MLNRIPIVFPILNYTIINWFPQVPRGTIVDCHYGDHFVAERRVNQLEGDLVVGVPVKHLKVACVHLGIPQFDRYQTLE